MYHCLKLRLNSGNIKMKLLCLCFLWWVSWFLMMSSIVLVLKLFTSAFIQMILISSLHVVGKQFKKRRPWAMSMLANWMRLGNKAWAGSWMIFTQTATSALGHFTCLWESNKNHFTFIIFSFSYFPLSIWIRGTHLLSKMSTKLCKKTRGWTSPLSPEQASRANLVVLTSAHTHGRKGTCWHVILVFLFTFRWDDAWWHISFL